MGTLVIHSRKYGDQIVQYDDDDKELIFADKNKWCVATQDGKTFYALKYIQRSLKKKLLYMHRIIMRAQPGMHVDHKDRNGLNNQKINLRLATPAQNHQNKPSYKISRTGYRGVYLQVDTKSKYAARITVKRKVIQSCGHSSAYQAALAYNELAKKHHGEFAILNQV